MSREKQIDKMAKDLCENTLCCFLEWKNCEPKVEEYCADCKCMAERLYTAGYRKQSEGEWIVTENGCVINCSECGYRLELCYPDGTEVHSLPHCPNCGAKMKGV